MRPWGAAPTGDRAPRGEACRSGWYAGRLAAAAVLALLLGPAALGAQRLPQLPPPSDTIPPAAARADALPADTLPADTVLSPRERAMERLRALPTTPVQPDTSAVADEAEADAVEADAEATEPTDEAPDDVDAEVPEPDDAAVEVDPTAPRRPLDRALTPDTAEVVRDEAAIRALLTRLEGYVATEYRGEAAVFEGQGQRLRLSGDSRVGRDGNAIETDSLLVYSGVTGLVCGYGNPVLTGDAEPVESDRVCYDIDRGLGMAEGARTTFVQGGTWYVRGPRNRVFLLDREPAGELYGERAQFTSCDLPEPHYVFEARSLKMVGDDIMVARNVTLRFEDVPVFWLPWMVQSLKPDRRSGLLTPQFGVNDIVRNRTGYNRRISNLGYYWAINDYASALVAFEWFSNNYTSLEGNLTYRWLRQFLEGRIALRQYWRQEEFGPGRRDLSVNTTNSWRPDERTNINVSGDYATSTGFVRDYSFDPRELNRDIRANASLNRTFDWGSMTLGARRAQQITDDRIDWTLPSLGLTLRPITLFAGADGTGGLTWSGSGRAERTLREVNHELTPNARGQEVVNASADHRLALGRLSLSQSVSFRDQTESARPPIERPDTILPALPDSSTQTLNWSSALSFQQTLWSGTTFSPQVSVAGNQIRNDATGGSYVSAPNRISAGATLATTIYGFWPGFGDYERIRHKISPSLNWSYSPGVTTSPLQDSIFGVRNLREQNRIGLSFNQTFEAKVRGDREEPAPRRNGAPARPADGAAEPGEEEDADDPDPAPVEAEEPAPGEPRRLPPSRTINLLSINTSTTFQYDFVAAREEGRGFLTEQITNSIRSDLLPGLQIGVTHHLFEMGDTPEDGGLPSRSFSPYLTNLNTSFSLDNNFWLLRILGLSGTRPDPDAEPEPEVEEDEDAFDLDRRDDTRGSIVSRTGGPGMGLRSPRNGWRATLSYSLNRPRPLAGATTRPQSQSNLNGQLAFSPTEHWSVNWTTSYSFTTGQFDTHVLTLTRDLHRWQANFDFIKAPNGNFALQFRVHLLDNPDLKVDYDQRTDPSDRLRMSQ
jgi:hypothetical protein